MGLFQDLANIGVKRGYNRYVLRLEPILLAIGERGMPVSLERHAEVSAELERRLNEAEMEMQALVPDEVRPFVPKGGYKKLPNDFAGANPQLPAPVDVGSVEGPDNPQPSTGAGVLGGKGPCEFMRRKFADGEDRWVRLLPWKPSRVGLIRYMKHRGHPVPLDYKSGKETTLEAELEHIAARTKDPLYRAVLKYRQLSTIVNNHLANWTPDVDGRVHPTFYYDPGTGQLASRRPNVQNAPRHGEGAKRALADAFRSMVIARPGCMLLEFDYRSFHVQTLAFESCDSDYLRLAKLDIHSYLAAHFVRSEGRDNLLQLGDEELADRLREIRAQHGFVRDFKAKQAVLGYGFGMGYRKLYMMNRESFDSMAEAKRLVDTLNALFPRVAQWRNDIRAQAHEQGYLLSRFGCIRWFWEVFKWSGDKWAPGGDDSEAAVAFLPANDAFCHIKEAMLRLEEMGWLKRAGLINQLHDALLFECLDSLVDEAISTIQSEMEMPSAVLVNETAPAGLSVAVDVKCGKSWDKMERVCALGR